MRQGLGSNWLTLDFQLVSLMRRKSRYSVERLLTWHLRSSAKLNMQVHQLMYGLLVYCYLLFCVVDSHSKGKTTKNFTPTSADRSFQLLTTSPDKPNSYYWKFSKRTLTRDQAVKISSETHGFSSQLEIKRWCPLNPLLSSNISRKLRVSTLEHKTSPISLEWPCKVTIVEVWVASAMVLKNCKQVVAVQGSIEVESPTISKVKIREINFMELISSNLLGKTTLGKPQTFKRSNYIVWALS